MKKIFFLTLLTFSISAHAGIFELGASANYRHESYDENNFITSNSHTISLAYYFMEMSAIELSYTTGLVTQTTLAPLQEKETIYTRTEISGLDFILSFAGRRAVFQPYIKAGGAYVKKEKFFETASVGTLSLNGGEGLVPSAGIGFKIRLTQSLLLKLGADAWNNPIDKQSNQWDYVGKVGLSWYL
ncbi:MAG: hypothetical protein D6797_02825 [Bdellovibrio sp.]|nr:MAG: hypothetical protein D6797_02825 [Bdellovibrio sp.]